MPARNDRPAYLTALAGLRWRETTISVTYRDGKHVRAVAMAVSSAIICLLRLTDPAAGDRCR
jgi:hypothetical protein